MVHGVRRKAEVERLPISARLKARVGALLRKGTEVTPALLEGAVGGSPVEKFLLDPALLAAASDPAAVAAFAKRRGARLGIAAVAAERAAVLVLAEEVSAEEAWEERGEEPPSGLPAASAPAARPGVPERRGGEDRRRGSDRRAAEEETAGASAPEEQAAPAEDRLLAALTSPDAAERLRAIKRFALSAAAPARKGEAYLRLLDDADSEVRCEAARLLTGLGLDRQAASDIVRLERGDARERRAVLARLSARAARPPGDRPAPGPSGLDAAACAAILLRRLAAEKDEGVLAALLHALEETAEAFAAAPVHAGLLLRRLIAFLAARPAALYPAARRLLARLAGGAARPALEEALAASGDPLVRQFLLLALAENAAGADRRRFSERIAEELRRPEEGEGAGGLDGQAYGRALLRMPREGLAAVARVLPGAPGARKVHLLRLLDELWFQRADPIGAEEKEGAIQAVLPDLSHPDPLVRRTVLELKAASDRELAEETRRRLADGFLEGIAAPHYPADRENVEEAIVRMGLPAVAPLLRRLDPPHPSSVRALAARIVGEIARREGGRGDLSARERGTLQEAQRRLLSASLDPFEGRGEAFVALGKIAASPACPPEEADLLFRTLWERRGEPGVCADASRAVGWAVSGAAGKRERAKEVADFLRAKLQAAGPEFEGGSVGAGVEEGEKVFDLGAGIDHYAREVPACLEGLRLTALGRGTPKAVRGEIIRFLLDRWGAAVKGEVDWEPLNVRPFVAALQAIALSPGPDEEERTLVVKALCTRVDEETVMGAVGGVLAALDRPGILSDLAGIVLLRLLSRRDAQGRFKDVERETVLRCLGTIALRRHLPSRTPRLKRLRETVVDLLLDGLKDSVPGCYERLMELREAPGVPRELKKSIEERLSPYHGLAVTP